MTSPSMIKILVLVGLSSPRVIYWATTGTPRISPRPNLGKNVKWVDLIFISGVRGKNPGSSGIEPPWNIKSFYHGRIRVGAEI